MIQIIKQRFNSLKQTWQYADSQPTEILLAVVNIFLTPIATYMELGTLWFFHLCLILTGFYQLMCVSKGELSCRVRASVLTFGMYFSTLIMYLGSIGLPTPSHWGWFILCFASFSSLRRIKREQLTRLWE